MPSTPVAIKRRAETTGDSMTVFQVDAGGSAAPAVANGSSYQPVTLVDSSGTYYDPRIAGGTWGYSAGVSGTVTLTGGKRVLQITAIAQQAAATITINGGQDIVLPYGSTDKVSSSITIEPKGNLTNPVLVLTGTSGYFVEWVS